MKMFGRRSFLRALGAAPLAAKAAAEAATKQLGRIGAVGFRNESSMSLSDIVNHQSIGATVGLDNAVGNGALSRSAKREAMRMILADSKKRAEIRTLLYQSNRVISRIDPDIGGRRSWSLAAKIAYQRERFVERDLAEEFQDATAWQIMQGWVEDQLKNFILR